MDTERQLVEEFMEKYTLKAVADFAKQEFGNRLSVYAVQGLMATLKMQVDHFFEKREEAQASERKQNG